MLVPLAATAFLTLGWHRDLWRRFGPVVILLALVGAFAAVFAVESGEALQSPVRRAAAEAGVSARFGHHPAYGNLVRAFAVLFAASLLAVWLADRKRDNSQPWSRVWIVAQVGGMALALLAIVSVTLAGHSGSKLVWNDLGSFAAGRSPTPVPPIQPGSAAGSMPPVSPAVPEGAILVDMHEFRFEPKEVRVAAGGDVTLVVVNSGRVNHTFTVVELRLNSGVLRPGETKALSFAAPNEHRTYQIICTEEGHDEEGMLGKLVVQ